MFHRFPFRLMAIFLGLVLAGFATAQSQAPPTIKNISAKEAADVPAKPTEEQKLGLQTLETSEAASRGFEAPMRSYGLLQVGATLAGVDAKKARSLLCDAFVATLEIHREDDTKIRLQWEILRTLVPLAPGDAGQLLPGAEPRVRNQAANLILGIYAQKKQVDKGLQFLQQVAMVDEMPYGGASALMDAMPPAMAPEKQALFAQAIASYKAHKHQDALIGGSTLAGMINRLGLTMPPKLTLEGIDEILSQAKSKADQEVGLAGPGGSVKFASDYQYQLFALISILQKLDENRAKQLLDENQDLQAKVQQFPQGLNSVMSPRPPSANANGANPPASANSGRPIGTLPDYLRRDAQGRIEAIVQEAESDPAQAIAHCMTLPLQAGQASPRADALEAIARANAKKDPGRADDALMELRKVAGDLPLEMQAHYLASAGGLYLEIGEKDKAGKVVNEGLKVSDKLLEQDAGDENPNKPLKAWWPSTDAYRSFIELQTKVSDRGALAALREIKDSEIRTLESIMFARSLLDLPSKR